MLPVRRRTYCGRSRRARGCAGLSRQRPAKRRLAQRDWHEAAGGGPLVPVRESSSFLPTMPFCRSNRQLTGILKGMAGPAASILSPKRLTASDLQILLTAFPGELMKQNSKGDEWVFRTRPDGNTSGSLKTHPHLMYISTTLRKQESLAGDFALRRTSRRSKRRWVGRQLLK